MEQLELFYWIDAGLKEFRFSWNSSVILVSQLWHVWLLLFLPSWFLTPQTALCHLRRPSLQGKLWVSWAAPRYQGQTTVVIFYCCSHDKVDSQPKKHGGQDVSLSYSSYDVKQAWERTLWSSCTCCGLVAISNYPDDLGKVFRRFWAFPIMMVCLRNQMPP